MSRAKPEMTNSLIIAPQWIGDAVRVTGKNRDDLQEAMAMIKAELPDMPLSFNNFRD